MLLDDDGLPDEPELPDDWLVLPGVPWLPDEPELPDELWLPDELEEGDELGIDGGEEDEVELLDVAQPASAAATANTGHIHDCL